MPRRSGRAAELPGADIFRPLYFIAGVAFVLIGIVGIFVPLLPTTGPLILAAWCFSKSSRRAEAWLLNHRVFGPAIIAWRYNGAIARKHKLMAVTGMGVGLVLFWLGAHPPLWLGLLVAAALIACAVFVWTRPEPDADDQTS